MKGDLPAYPVTIKYKGICYEEYTGLSMREQFAISIMSGMVANNSSNSLRTDYIATLAVKAADELIIELNK